MFKAISNAHRQIQYGGQLEHFSQNESSVGKTTVPTLSQEKPIVRNKTGTFVERLVVLPIDDRKRRPVYSHLK